MHKSDADKLTKRVIEQAPVRSEPYFVWDSDLTGFGLRVLPSGRKSFVVRCC
jgi:hypothetical protein